MSKREMSQFQIPSWLQQRPWLMLPLLGLIPLSALAFRSEQPAPPPTATAPAAIAPTPLLSPFTPSAIVPTASSPAPTVKSAAKPTPKTSPKATSAQPSPAAKPNQTGPLPELTAEQKAMNQKAKAQFAPHALSVDAVIEMHVAIGKGSSLDIATSNGGSVLDQNGHPLNQLASRQAYSFQVSGQNISVGGEQLPGAVVIDPAPGGIFYLNSRPYRGRLMVVSNGSALLAVNYVNLKNYLYSVVASEVSPSWPAAALKAQAIAARSYALTYYFRPVHSLYHLGSDEYYQVYSGIEKEAPASNQAVDQTAGEFVSYRGGIVESLYAASDDIVMDAFQGKGMSQLGALSLSKQGYSYEQILSHYYPKTGVGRIELDQE
jgi:stage II sporulation protein D